MKKCIWILLLVLTFICCESRREDSQVKEVRIKSRYVFEKIYIADSLGWTHEILVATSGNTLGGVEMLELCVYKDDGRTEEIDREPKER